VDFIIDMVSPRKKVASVQNQTHQSADRAKYRTKYQVFIKKKFFLDIKNLESLPVKLLTNDLKRLGGNIEPFFSKEVTHIISEISEAALNLKLDKLKAASAASGTNQKLGLPNNLNLQHFAPSPSTSVGGTPGGGLNKNSPDLNTWSPLSVQDQNLPHHQNQKFFVQAKSRVETILEIAKQKKAEKSCVIDTALKLGIKVWCLPKIIAWIEQLKDRIGNFDKLDPENHPKNQALKRKRSSVEQALEAEQLKTLKSPFIKYDDSNHECRPVWFEFKKFPRIYCGGRAGQSPFFNPEAHFVKTHKIREFPERKLAEKSVVQPKKPSVPIPNQNQNPHQVNKNKVNNKKVNKVPQSGYCEICEAPFSELEEHISSKVHIARVGLSNLWTKLDSCIKQVNKTTSEEDESETEIDNVVQHLDESVM